MQERLEYLVSICGSMKNGVLASWIEHKTADDCAVVLRGRDGDTWRVQLNKL